MDASSSMQDLDENATIQRLTGQTGVFVGGDDDLEAARVRYEAIKAIQAHKATPEQRALVNDLDVVLQHASAGTHQVPEVPHRYPQVAPRAPIARPVGIPTPPRHSRFK